ncbi:MAG TPA: hypothetical protein VFU47_17275 [Armatimonadota bacterium]|nr:hypothetical protein [Armatimonadota bacterium]
MQASGAGDRATRDAMLDAMLAHYVPFFDSLTTEHRGRLRAMAASLEERGMPPSFIGSSLRSTAEVLKEIHEEETRPDNVFQREHVRRFVQENPAPPPARTFPNRNERKREERDRLLAHALRLLREARQARGRHEVKKTRNMLLKLDQRELRRRLGAEGDDLCRQINTWLRSNAALF